MITLVPHDPQWSHLYQVEKQKIIDTAGDWIEDIQHVGSTAIPNISAKPVIDILIGVTSLEEVDKHVINKIKELGYTYIKAYEKDAPERRYFEKLDKEGNHTHHVHLVPINSFFWRRLIAFRDYLRNHPTVANEYEQLKLNLVKNITDRSEYVMGKSEFVLAIQNKALEEI